MNIVLFLSGKETYFYEFFDDFSGGNRLNCLERTEAVELLLTGKTQRSYPRPKGCGALRSAGDS